MFENFIDQLQLSVTSISAIQWVLIVMIILALIAAVIGLCLLVDNHPILTAISGLIITIALPVMIEKIHLARNSMTLIAIILMFACAITLRICVQRGLL